MAEDTQSGVGTEHKEPLYQRELLEKAKGAQEPVTNVEDDGDTIRVHAIQEYDGTAWRAMIRAYRPSDSPPSVSFAESHWEADHKTMREWSALATGRLSGPQRLPRWESLFTVFNSALGEYKRLIEQEDSHAE